MGQQYQDTISSFAASPQAMEPQQQVSQNAGNNTPGKSIEQSPMHDGFGTRSGMYDNGMDASAQPAPVAMPPQPQNQPSSAGVTPSWAQQGRKRGGRATRADGGGLITATTGMGPGYGTGASNPQGMYATFANASPLQTGVNAVQQPSMMMGGDWMANYQARPEVQKMMAPVTAARQAAQSMVPPTPTDVSTNPNVANDALLTQMYQQFLGRNPDLEGEKFWSNAMNQGMSVSDIAAALSQSGEAAKRQNLLDAQKYATQRADMLQSDIGAAMAPAAMRQVGPAPVYSTSPSASEFDRLAQQAAAQADVANQQYTQKVGENLSQHYGQLVSMLNPTYKAAIEASGGKLTPEIIQKMANDKDALDIINKWMSSTGQ